MKQRCNQSHDRALGAEAHSSLDAALVPHQQARHRQGHIQGMLAIVINRIDAVVTRHASREELVELFERNGDSVERLARKGSNKQFAHRGGHRRRGTDLYRIRHVVVVTAKVVHPGKFRLIRSRAPWT